MVADFVGDHVPGSGEDAVVDGDEGSFLAVAVGQLPVAGVQVGVVGAGGRGGGFAEGAVQPVGCQNSVLTR